MNKQDTILNLYRTGVKPADIAAQMGVSASFVYRVLRGAVDANTIETPALNEANYIKAIKRGYETRQDLAKYFHVGRGVVSEFERESGIPQLLAKYFYSQGKSLSEIGQLLHLRIGSIQIPPDFPTIEKVRRDLTAILEIYEEMAKYGDAETVQYNALKRLLEKL